jgi:hypothetical protein
MHVLEGRIRENQDGLVLAALRDATEHVVQASKMFSANWQSDEYCELMAACTERAEEKLRNLARVLDEVEANRKESERLADAHASESEPAQIVQAETGSRRVSRAGKSRLSRRRKRNTKALSSRGQWASNGPKREDQARTR